MITKNLIPNLDEKACKRFSSYFIKCDDNDCWQWKNKPDKNGYGIFVISKKNYRAHRVSYKLAYDVDPKDYLVCHRCDNPGCVNPKHLFLGTNKDNVQDMRSKKRHSYGEKSKRSTLTEKDILKMRKMARDGIPYNQIAKKLNIGISLTSHAVKGRCWAHLKGAIKEPKKPLTGKDHYKTKLDVSDVLNIRELSKKGYSQSKIAKKYNISQSGVCAIVNKITWKHI